MQPPPSRSARNAAFDRTSRPVMLVVDHAAPHGGAVGFSVGSLQTGREPAGLPAVATLASQRDVPTPAAQVPDWIGVALALVAVCLMLTALLSVPVRRAGTSPYGTTKPTPKRRP